MAKKHSKHPTAAKSSRPDAVPPKPTPSPDRTVSGHVFRRDEKPLAKAAVYVFSQSINGENLIAEGKTNREGFYEISYCLKNPAARVDLRVKVKDARGKELAVSAIVFAAKTHEVVDLTAAIGDSRTPAEFERLRDGLAPFLKGLIPAALTPEQVAYVQGASGLEASLVSRFVLAAQVAAETHLSSEIFYGLFRGDVPLSLDGILAQDPSVSREVLQQSLGANLIPAVSKKTQDAFFSALRLLLTKRAFTQPAVEGRASLGDLLISTPALSRAKAEELLRQYSEHSGPVKDFWQGLRKKPAFKNAVDDIQFSLQAGLVTGNHLPLVNALNDLRKTGKLEHWKELAAWEVSDWKRLLAQRTKEGPVGVPEDIPGKTAGEKLDNYATALATQLEEAFPTQAIVARMAKSDTALQETLGGFFKKNPGFDLVRKPVDVYLAETPRALDGVKAGEKDGLKRELRALQRLAQITPRFAEINELRDADVRSARDATRMGPDAFAEKFEKKLGKDRTRKVYEEAEWRASMAVNVMARFHPDINVSVAVLADPLPADVTTALPDWESLFGSQDFCACDQCRSVLSLAAYFTDVLHFVKNRSSLRPNRNAKDILFSRRPDLGEIELSCENTNTVVPYVDLTNELLEEAVAPATAVPVRQRQSCGSAAELAANPEHPNPGAYDVLRTALYPWTLPFDLWTEETRVYLAHLGVDRVELMRAFAPKTGAIPDSTAAEALGLIATEREIVTGTHADSASPWKFWGFASSTGWVDQAKKIREFLRRSGLRYEDLETLLATRFVNPGSAIKVVSTDAADPFTCDTNKLALAGPSSIALGQFLDRLQRFVRLQRRLGWTPRALDAAISALQPSAGLSSDFIRALAAVRSACSRFQLESEEVLAWYTAPDTTAGPEDAPKSFYERLFQNPAVIKRPAGETDPFALNTDRTELNVTTGSLNGVRPALSSSIGLSETDLALLIDSPQAVVTSDKKLKLENLFRLFRTASLARVLNLSIPDFLTARLLITTVPFGQNGQPTSAAQVEGTLTFADQVEKVRVAGTSFDALNYLLRHRGPIEVVTPEDETFTTFLGEVRTALRSATTDDLKTEAVAQKLSSALNVDVSVPRYFLSDWRDQPATPTHRLKAYFLVSSFWSVDDAITALRYPDLFRSLRRLYKTTGLATALRLSPEALVWTARNASSFGWLTFQSLPGDETEPAAAFAGWERLTDFFSWTQELPAAAGAAFLEVLSAAVATGGTPSAVKRTILEKVALATGWPLADLETLLGTKDQPATQGLLGYAFPGDYADERLWLNVSETFALCKRLGSSAAQAAGWAAAAPSRDDARAAKQAAKSKHDEETWLGLAKPLRDVLREKQRAALVDYLSVRPNPTKGWNWEDATGLAAHFLIDVEMTPCQMTSRLKQAAASVQLFLQRCLMNLETDVKADAAKDAAWLQWKWMKTYRVWEANRKVFLWPENWIEPELRDDKSELFQELEEELLQNDVTQETAERAFLNYVEKLDQVSNLEIGGVYHETDTDVDRLHVFGRTAGQPHVWYYRCREDGWRWTSWERVDLDIEGGQVLPMLWDGRLRILWPSMTEESNPDSELTMPAAGGMLGKPKKIWKVQLAWSERVHGKWTPKRLPNTFLPVPYAFTKDKKRITLNSSGTQSNITWIHLWVGGGAISEYVGAFFFPQGVLEPGLLPISTQPFASNYTLSPRPAPFFSGLGGSVLLEGSFVKARPSVLNQPMSLARLGTPAYRSIFRYSLGGIRLSYPQQYPAFDYFEPFFVKDEGRMFFVSTEPSLSTAALLAADAVGLEAGHVATAASGDQKLFFQSFYHPFVPEFALRLRSGGVDRLMERELQFEERNNFKSTYHPELVPQPLVAEPYPKEEVEFASDGAYSPYNWEVFFHAPLLIADRLCKNQKFEEAQHWFHYIFDPTDTSGEDAPQKYWRTRRFFETTKPEYAAQEIRRLLQSLADGTGDPELENQVSEWRKNPFKPHAIARLRTVAYQKTVVMKYIDNLVAWGDSLFRRDTIESINEATQLYVLAAEILGRRPEFLKPRAMPATQTFNSLETLLHDGDFSDPAVTIEGYISSGGKHRHGSPTKKGTAAPIPHILLFCVPRNEKLLGYWDLVADRLFKIRNCMNIEGRRRSLPLFDPPINPALLVKAAASGVDLSDVMGDLSAPLPPYRFQTLSQKATELCSELKSLGGALLAALEKKDAEALSLLRSSQEIRVLTAARQIRDQQIKEATESLEGFNRGKELITLRRNYYRDIQFLNPWETVGLGLSTAALTLQTAEIAALILSGGLHLIPNAKLGAPPSIGLTYGGDNAGEGAKCFGASLGEVAGLLNAGAALANTLGAHSRRWDDWKLQESLAEKEIEQIDRQIAAAQIRVAIAEQELKNHDLQVENAQAADAFMREKYTNRELYSWMSGQIATVYFQTYKLACDVAKRAERTFRFELGLETSDYVQVNYWDSLKKGLLAGDKLHYDIKRMETAYLDLNRRDYELVKTVSLAFTDPAALVKLKQTGECFFDLSEALFDMDHPGHYFRRIKSVALSVPCVTGPYQGVFATLILLPGSTLRKNALLSNNKYEVDGTADARFRTDLIAVKDSIATSTGREDSGLFDPNLRDERYLPFEGAGADSHWRLILDKDANRFDFNGISDVVLHVRYTARDGGDALRNSAKARLKVLQNSATTTPLVRLFSLKSAYSDSWHRFLHPAATDSTQSMPLDLTDRLPPGTKVSTLEFFLKVQDGVLPADPSAGPPNVPADIPLALYGNIAGTGANLLLNSPLQSDAALGKMHHRSAALPATSTVTGFRLGIAGNVIPAFLAKTMTVNNVDYKHLDPEKIEDIFLLCRLVRP